ncbi:hemerythrin domain-containing protein [Bernardetia sp.]|uniref:hemerythrin domain-containing protein n=1 Tax=Bernardetia sp. TaxID=1937974 RepID=UPI0025B7B7AB|nr:hemerythrin domain-containing protein [Bernardetia sp.]
MTTIFEALRKDHDIQRDLADKLIQTSGDTEERRSLYKQLKHELKIHADGEERHFYIPLFEDEKTQEHARHGVAEHHEMDELMEKLDETDMSSPAWLTYAKQLQDKVHHHLKDEEHTIFQLAGKVLSEKQKGSLANDYQSYIDKERE